MVGIETGENSIDIADGSFSIDGDKPLIISIDESVLSIVPEKNSESVLWITETTVFVRIIRVDGVCCNETANRSPFSLSQITSFVHFVRISAHFL